MHSVFVLAALFAVAAPLPRPVTAAQPQSRMDDRKSSGERFDNYQIPAGTALLLELRTPFDSASAKVDDEVEATLWSPVIQGGVELIPSGSVLSGKVTAVVRASKPTPVGSVAFVLSVVQHAGSSDRAMLPTQKIVMEAPVAKRPSGRGAGKIKPTDASMAEGARFVAITSEPLIVRIPK